MSCERAREIFMWELICASCVLWKSMKMISQSSFTSFARRMFTSESSSSVSHEFLKFDGKVQKFIEIESSELFKKLNSRFTN